VFSTLTTATALVSESGLGSLFFQCSDHVLSKQHPPPPPLPAERASFGRHRLPLHDDDEKHSQYTDLLLHLMRSKMATTEAEFLHLDESEVGVAFLADSFLIQFT